MQMKKDKEKEKEHNASDYMQEMHHGTPDWPSYLGNLCNLRNFLRMVIKLQFISFILG